MILLEKPLEEKLKWLASREEVYKFSKNRIDTLFRCPVYKCLSKFNNQAQLKSHISRKHKELEDAGIEVSASGKVKYPPQLVDHVMRVMLWQRKFVFQNLKKDLDKRLKEADRQELNQLPQHNGASNGF